MLDGKIAETGTYDELMLADGALAKLVAEHVSEQHAAEAPAETAIETAEDQELKRVEIETKIEEDKEATISADADSDLEKGKDKPDAKAGGLMIKEERATGAVQGKVYAQSVSVTLHPDWNLADHVRSSGTSARWASSGAPRSSWALSSLLRPPTSARQSSWATGLPTRSLTGVRASIWASVDLEQ